MEDSNYWKISIIHERQLSNPFGPRDEKNKAVAPSLVTLKEVTRPI